MDHFDNAVAALRNSRRESINGNTYVAESYKMMAKAFASKYAKENKLNGFVWYDVIAAASNDLNA